MKQFRASDVERMRLALEAVSESLSDNMWRICEALEGNQ